MLLLWICASHCLAKPSLYDCGHFSLLHGESLLSMIRYYSFMHLYFTWNDGYVLYCLWKIYWPKHDDVGRCLKVECTPVLGQTEYPSIFAVSFPVLPGTVLNPYVRL